MKHEITFTELELIYQATEVFALDYNIDEILVQIVAEKLVRAGVKARSILDVLEYIYKTLGPLEFELIRDYTGEVNHVLHALNINVGE